jgi:hypothetical protein
MSSCISHPPNFPIKVIIHVNPAKLYYNKDSPKKEKRMTWRKEGKCVKETRAFQSSTICGSR